MPAHATGISRRHFVRHLAEGAALAGPFCAFGRSLWANAASLQRRRKAAILLWMSGGPSTIDMWDLKPGAATGGPFRPISTRGDLQICEHLPMMAEQMRHLAIIRSMSTREADHGRGRYYMHTGFPPSPSVEHPGCGSVVAHELLDPQAELDIPPFVSIGGASIGPGFLGMDWAPFSVDSNGRMQNVSAGVEQERLRQRLAALDLVERGFIGRRVGQAAEDHRSVLRKAYRLMSSDQLAAFRIDSESAAVRERYGDNNFGRGCLLARRLVEQGAPFVEVESGGWDNHQNVHAALRDNKLPELDRAMSALVEDLQQRGMLQDTVLLWMGEFGRTPRINANAGRDHWARAWSVVVGGGALQGGIAVGQTSDDGSQVESEPYSAQDLLASVCQALGISLETTFTTRSGRPMKIANGGKVIRELFA